MKVITIKQPGGPEVLEFGERDDPSPEGDQVCVDIKAVGLNWSETMIRRGDWPLDLGEGFVPGAEAAGVVESVGPDVKRIRPGERVAVLEVDAFQNPAQGTYAEKIAVSENKVLPLPPQFTYAQGAALPMAWLTAYDAMVQFAPLPEAGTVVVTACTGAVGLAAMKVARMKGLRVIGTTRADSKVETVRNLGFEIVAAADPKKLRQKLADKTKSRGIDYVFDPIAGETLTELIPLINLNGTYIVYGMLGGDAFSVPASFLFNQVSIRGYVVLASLADSAKLQRTWRELLPALEDNALPVAKEFPFGAVRQAHEFMEAHDYVGKVVLTL